MSNKPTIVQSNFNETVTTSDAFILNKPTVQDGQFSQNNFTDTLKTKLTGIADGADVTPSWARASTANIADTLTLSKATGTGLAVTSDATVGGDVSVGGKILIREGIGGTTATRGAIYAEVDPAAAGSNHRLIIDPYQEDDADPAAGTANNGTVYVRGSLIVEGNKTILDTAETITAENLFGIGATKNSSGTTVGGLATEVGIHVYSGTTSNEHFVYDFSAAKWRTGSGLDTNLKDLEAKNIYAAFTGDLTGNAATATKISTITNNNIVQLIDTQTLTNKTLTSPTLNSPTIDIINVGASPGPGTDGQFLISKGPSASAEWYTLSLTTTLSDLTDTTISSVASNDLLRYDGSTNEWVNSDSIDIKSVNATTIGNIVPVRINSTDARVSVKTITATTTGVPIHADILAYYTGKTFAAGKCVAALTDGANSSVTIFSFSICNTSLTLTLDQEVSSLTTAVEIDYDSGGTVNLNVGANVASGTNNIKYCVKVLPIMTSDSITGAY